MSPSEEALAAANPFGAMRLDPRPPIEEEPIDRPRQVPANRPTRASPAARKSDARYAAFVGDDLVIRIAGESLTVAIADVLTLIQRSSHA